MWKPSDISNYFACLSYFFIFWYSGDPAELAPLVGVTHLPHLRYGPETQKPSWNFDLNWRNSYLPGRWRNISLNIVLILILWQRTKREMLALIIMDLWLWSQELKFLKCLTTLNKWNFLCFCFTSISKYWTK